MTLKNSGGCIFSRAILIVGILSICSLSSFAQEPFATPSPSPSPDFKVDNSGKNLVKNVLSDQKAIWTAPFHLSRHDAAWALPLTGAALSLIATDRNTAGELIEHGDHPSEFRTSQRISEIGSYYSTGTVAGVFYLVGHFKHNERARETGFLLAETMIDGAIVGGTLKLASQRQRPIADDASGEFWDGGSSFPSGHAINAWSVATILDQEYGKHRPVLKLGLYGLATAVSVTRYTGRKHFLSDVLVGSAIGYGLGRYVYQRHHDPSLDQTKTNKISKVLESRFFPTVVPEYSPRAETYGAALAWSF
jgi:membrane-associated phospholipid phosphatase